MKEAQNDYYSLEDFKRDQEERDYWLDVREREEAARKERERNLYNAFLREKRRHA